MVSLRILDTLFKALPTHGRSLHLGTLDWSREQESTLTRNKRPGLPN